MMYSADQVAARITARPVRDEDRLKALPRHFGRLMMSVETVVNAYMRELCTEYQGGAWAFYDLSNGGFYMAPTGNLELRLVVAGNYFEARMSPDAAGIVACLFAYGYLANSTGSDAMTDHYHALRIFARGHAEADLILMAID